MYDCHYGLIVRQVGRISPGHQTHRPTFQCSARAIGIFRDPTRWPPYLTRRLDERQLSPTTRQVGKSGNHVRCLQGHRPPSRPATEEGNRPQNLLPDVQEVRGQREAQDMNEDLRKERARMARALADKADPFIKRRLLDLAARYEQTPRPVTPIPTVDPVEKDAG
jgi:hypothetical protein